MHREERQREAAAQDLSAPSPLEPSMTITRPDCLGDRPCRTGVLRRYAAKGMPKGRHTSIAIGR
jgi:hypothetical protein